MGQRQVVVVGGGVSGLATAHYLTRGDNPPAVTVLEAGPMLGGKVRTVDLAGRAVDTGPDALLVRSPVVNALLEVLGLDPLRRAPDPSGAYIWARGGLRRLPQGSIFGVPNRLLPLLRSGLVGPFGFLRAGADLVLPRREEAADPTIEELLRPRFGRQVYQNLIEPMLGGVHAGRADRLSARSAVPEVAAMVRGHRSLFLALRGKEPRTGGGPALITLDGGLTRLVEALTDSARAAGVQIRTDSAATALARTPAGYRVEVAGHDPVEADDVVLAVPAWAAVPLLAPLTAMAAGAAAEIRYAGVATVTFAYPRSVLTRPGTGFLVPPAEGRLLVGCTWLSSKWPSLADSETALIRCMVGRDGDDAWAALDDEALIAAIRAELAEAMDVTAEPERAYVRRMPQAMPQYAVGHADRLAVIDAALAELPGLTVTGAGYRGVGLASCIAAARTTAEAVLARPALAATR